MRTRSSPDVPAGPRRLSGAAVVAGALTVLLLAGSALADDGSPVQTPTGAATYNTGQLQVDVLAPTPAVEMFQDANHSIGAALVIEEILELQPGNGPNPTIVQFASPTSPSPTHHSSESSGQSSFKLDVNGTFPVLRTQQPLYPGPRSNPPSPNSSGSENLTAPGASLVVNFALNNSTSLARQGLSLRWSVLNWPWLDDHDLLGVEWKFVDFNGSGFETCAAPPTLTASSTTGCLGSAIEPGSVAWDDSSVTSVVGQAAAGLTAAFSWSPEASASGSATPVSVGAFNIAPDTARVTLVTAGGGSSNVTVTGAFEVSTPLLSLPLALVTGDGPAYTAAVVVTLGVAMSGILLYRRSERRALEEL